MNMFTKNDYKMTIENTTNQVAATLIFNDGQTFTGIAKYHDGDTYNAEVGTKMAKAKAWRAAWNFYKRTALADSKNCETEMNNKIDIACACNKKEQELDAFIKKLAEGEITF